MNVDAEIVVEEADNVIAVPVNSVNRGNIVFVKDDGTTHENDVTDIIRVIKINRVKRTIRKLMTENKPKIKTVSHSQAVCLL